MDIKALHEETQKSFTALTDALKQYDTEVKAHGAAHAETKAKIEKINDRLDELDTLIRRKSTEVKAQQNAGEYDTPTMRATEKFLRFGTKGGYEQKLTDEEKQVWAAAQTKALTSGADANGGIFVPEDFRLEIIQRLPNFANVGNLVNRVTTSRDTLRYPNIPYAASDDIKSSGVAVTWEDDTDTLTETDFAMGSVAVPVKKARALIKVPVELLEDTAVDIIGLIANLFAQSYGIEEDAVFTNGAGGKKPEGFMTNVDITAINNGHATVLQYDGLMDFIYGLPEQYAGNAVIMCKRSFVRDLRKVKDTQNHPLWAPAVSEKAPQTFAGYPIKTNEQMPAIASGAKPALFGDFKQLYLVADRVGLTIKRLDERYADQDMVGFIARRRVGGKVSGYWAGRKLNMA